MKKIIFLPLFALLLIGLVIALSFDNTKTLEKDGYKYGKVTIKDGFGFGNTLAEIKLTENTDFCYINCEAIGTITLYEKDYLIQSLRFKNFKNKKWKAKDYPYDIWIKTGEYEKTFDDYSCDKFNKCTKTGTHIEKFPIWEKYDGKELNTGTYTWRITGTKEKEETVDWLGTWFGIEVDDWALWIGNDKPYAYYSLDEGSGTKIGSKTGVWNMTALNTPTWTSGKINNSLSFNGINQYGINKSSDLGLTNQLTVSAWFNATTFNSAGWLVGALNTTGSSYYGWSLSYASGKMVFYMSNITEDHNVLTDAVSTDKWYFVAGTYNGTDISVYLNGALNSTTDVARALINLTHYDITLGRHATLDQAARYWNGTIDEVGIWNRTLSASEINDLYNGGIGMSYGTNVLLVLPPDDAELIDDEINFTADFEFPTNLVNATLFVWYSNFSLYNLSVNTVSGTINTTNFTIPFANVDTYKWNTFVCDSLTCDFANVNRTFDYGYTINSEEYDTSIGDVKNATFTLNLSLADSVISSFVNLNYNNTLYATTTTSYDNANVYQTIIDIPAITEKVNHVLSWQISLTDSLRTIQFNTTSNLQEVSPSFLEYCNATYTIRAVNFSVYDEETLVQLNETSFDISYDWFLGSGEETKSRFWNLSEKTYPFCISPPQETFYVTSRIKLSKSGYNTRNYHLFEEKYTNATTEKILYLLNDSDATNVIIEVKDSGLRPLMGYAVQIDRYYPDLGEYRTVEDKLTDSFGQLTAKLVQNDISYRFRIYDTDGTLVKTSPNIIIACRASICVLQFVVADLVDDFDRFDDIDSFDYSLSFVNTTNNFVYSWTDTTGESSSKRLYVQRRLFNGTTIVCNYTSTSVVGSLSCAVGDTRASYQAQAFRKVTGEDEIRIAVLDYKVGDTFRTFGREGLFISFILLFTMVLIGLFSPSVGVSLYLVGIIILMVLGIVFISPAMLIAQIIIGVLFIWAFSR